MSTSHSVSEWVRQARQGDHDAACSLWRRYYRRLVRFARRRLQPVTPLCDEDDLAAQTLHSFLTRIGQGEFVTLADRRELWQLLITIALRKSANSRRDSLRLKRHVSTPSDSPGDLGRRAGSERVDSPEDTACLRERYVRLLISLDQELRAIVEHRIHGYTYVEIAARLQRSVPTVERRMRLLREKCREEGLTCPFE